MPPSFPRNDITGVILAGGRGTRLGGADKGLEDLAGRPLIAYILDTLRPQTATLLINANRNRTRYAEFGYPVLSDAADDYPGPLAGMLCALRATHTEYVLCVPCDAPLLPTDLAARLWRGLHDAGAVAAVARSAAGLEPVFTLLKTSLAANLQEFLDRGQRKTQEWLASLPAAPVDFSDCPDMLLNLNTPGDRERLLHALQVAHAC